MTVPAGTLGEIIGTIESAHPQFAPVRQRCSFLIDEISVRDLGTVVADGSRVDVLPPFAGG